ncbi:MAG: methyltransferase domain-containing protein, partial [Armatimonadota bacterium]|nr:methyltransferase domain-containing protein [Armatimonadota bacterium]
LRSAAPLAAAIVLAGIAATLAYVLTYFFLTKDRPAGKLARTLLASVGIAVIALLLLTGSLVVRHEGRPLWEPLAAAAAAVAGAVFLAWRAGSKVRARRERQLPIKRMEVGLESALAHRYLDGLRGIEVGGSLHNPFGLATWNVDITTSKETCHKKAELEIMGDTLPIDIAASGDELPLADQSLDFVVSSHVLEHFPDPIKALKEWYRVVRPGGYIFAVVAHKERTFDKDRPRTALEELVRRYENSQYPEDPLYGHYSVWVTEDAVELIRYLGWHIVEVQDVDDKVGNGFAVLVRKQ